MSKEKIIEIRDCGIVYLEKNTLLFSGNYPDFENHISKAFNIIIQKTKQQTAKEILNIVKELEIQDIKDGFKFGLGYDSLNVLKNKLEKYSK